MIPRVPLREALSDPNLLGTAIAGDSWSSWRTLLIAAMGEELLAQGRVVTDGVIALLPHFAAKGADDTNPSESLADAPFNLGHEKQLWLDSEFAFDHSLGFIPGWIVGEDLAPQRDDGRPICAGVGTNHNVAHLVV